MPPTPSGEPSTPGRPRPWALRDYAVLADGERGAVVGPHGEIVWLCAPRWDSDPVFSSLVGGADTFTVGPEDPWHVGAARTRTAPSSMSAAGSPATR